MRRALLLSVIASATLLSTPVAGQTHARLAREVFAAESSFAATMAARDHAEFARFIAPDAIFFGREPIRGKDAVLEAWAPFFSGPDAPFSWRPEIVEVLASGNLALTSGPVRDSAGKQTGSFNSIWRREPDGRWLVVFDKGSPPPCDCPR